MKTEMKTAYVALRGSNGFSGLVAEFDIDFDKQESGDYFHYSHLMEVEVAVPLLTEEEKQELMSGAELEALQKMKESIQAETHRKLMQIDERIGQLQALENKEG